MGVYKRSGIRRESVFLVLCPEEEHLIESLLLAASMQLYEERGEKISFSGLIAAVIDMVYSSVGDEVRIAPAKRCLGKDKIRHHISIPAPTYMRLKRLGIMTRRSYRDIVMYAVRWLVERYGLRDAARMIVEYIAQKGMETTQPHKKF